jgi:hypothetical protein
MVFRIVQTPTTPQQNNQAGFISRPPNLASVLGAYWTSLVGEIAREPLPPPAPLTEDARMSGVTAAVMEAANVLDTTSHALHCLLPSTSSAIVHLTTLQSSPTADGLRRHWFVVSVHVSDRHVPSEKDFEAWTQSIRANPVRAVMAVDAELTDGTQTWRCAFNGHFGRVVHLIFPTTELTETNRGVLESLQQLLMLNVTWNPFPTAIRCMTREVDAVTIGMSAKVIAEKSLATEWVEWSTGRLLTGENHVLRWLASAEITKAIMQPSSRALVSSDGMDGYCVPLPFPGWNHKLPLWCSMIVHPDRVERGQMVFNGIVPSLPSFIPPPSGTTVMVIHVGRQLFSPPPELVDRMLASLSHHVQDILALPIAHFRRSSMRLPLSSLPAASETSSAVASAPVPVPVPVSSMSAAAAAYAAASAAAAAASAAASAASAVPPTHAPVAPVTPIASHKPSKQPRLPVLAKKDAPPPGPPQTTKLVKPRITTPAPKRRAVRESDEEEEEREPAVVEEKKREIDDETFLDDMQRAMSTTMAQPVATLDDHIRPVTPRRPQFPPERQASQELERQRSLTHEQMVIERLARKSPLSEYGQNLNAEDVEPHFKATHRFLAATGAFLSHLLKPMQGEEVMGSAWYLRVLQGKSKSFDLWKNTPSAAGPHDGNVWYGRKSVVDTDARLLAPAIPLIQPDMYMVLANDPCTGKDLISPGGVAAPHLRNTVIGRAQRRGNLVYVYLGNAIMPSEKTFDEMTTIERVLTIQNAIGVYLVVCSWLHRFKEGDDDNVIGGEYEDAILTKLHRMTDVNAVDIISRMYRLPDAVVESAVGSVRSRRPFRAPSPSSSSSDESDGESEDSESSEDEDQSSSRKRLAPLPVACDEEEIECG